MSQVTDRPVKASTLYICISPLIPPHLHIIAWLFPQCKTLNQL